MLIPGDAAPGLAMRIDDPSALPVIDVKLEPLPAAVDVVRVPSTRFTVSVARSCTPLPVPLSA